MENVDRCNKRYIECNLVLENLKIIGDSSALIFAYSISMKTKLRLSLIRKHCDRKNCKLCNMEKKEKLRSFCVKLGRSNTRT